MQSSFSHLALLVPSVESSAKFLNICGVKANNLETFEKRGHSLHHIAIDVLDIEKFTTHAQSIYELSFTEISNEGL